MLETKHRRLRLSSGFLQIWVLLPRCLTSLQVLIGTKVQCCAVLYYAVLCCHCSPSPLCVTLRYNVGSTCMVSTATHLVRTSCTEIRKRMAARSEVAAMAQDAICIPERCHGSSLDCKAGGETRGELASSPCPSLFVPRSASPLLLCTV